VPLAPQLLGLLRFDIRQFLTTVEEDLHLAANS